MSSPTTKLILGTAQLGTPYGSFNVDNKQTALTAKDLLDEAHRLGINKLDTAASYPNSEEFIGESDISSSFEIITKIPRIIQENIKNTDVLKFQSTISESLSRLKCNTVGTLLAHNASDLLKPGGDKLYDFLIQRKEEGITGKIGVSAYSQSEVEDVLTKYRIDVVQLPVNVLDQRLIETNFLKTLASVGVEVHARSIFLQGLLLQRPNNIHSFFDIIKPKITLLNSIASSYNISTLAICIGFVNSIKQVSGLVVGLDNKSQLHQLVSAVDQITKVKLNVRDFGNVAEKNNRILNPSNWPKA
jgi:aryl-alcohol dehydrogenase-like predicted oxidoreductase